MKQIITAAFVALAFSLTACGDTPDVDETVTTTFTETTTPTDVIPETVQQQIEEAATEGRGPRPPLNEMTRIDGFGYVGLYMETNGRDHYICDARGYSTMDIMGDDGCSEPMERQEAIDAFRASVAREFGLDETDVPASPDCIGYGCSPEQDVEIAENEEDATARFWECMEAGGTEESCLQ